MKAGDLVTDRRSPTGAPIDIGSLAVNSCDDAAVWWMGCPVILSTCIVPISEVDRYLRPISDDEALRLAAWLLTGDPGAEWDDEADGDFAIGDETTLWSWARGSWLVSTDELERVAEGEAPTDRARRVAAARAFLAHLCGGAP